MRLFQGRINRQTYAVGLVIFLIYMFIIIVQSAFISPHFKNFSSVISPLILELLLIQITLAFVFFASLRLRRKHDMGKGWYGIGGDIGIENLVCLVKKGEKKTNKYGKPPDPKIDIKGLFGFS